MIGTWANKPLSQQPFKGGRTSRRTQNHEEELLTDQRVLVRSAHDLELAGLLVVTLEARV